MFSRPKIATAVLHVYIIAFLVVLGLDISTKVEALMLYCSPVFTFWMFYEVISSSPIRMNRVTAADDIL